MNLDDVALGTGGFKITGEAAYDFAGISVSSAGDVNGDGIDDIFVGAEKNDAAGTDAGAAYVIFGTTSSVSAINLDDVALGTGGFRLTGESAGDIASRGVSGAGDVNGDGFDDLLVGAKLNDAGGSDAGADYVLFGFDIHWQRHGARHGGRRYADRVGRCRRNDRWHRRRSLNRQWRHGRAARRGRGR